MIYQIMNPALKFVERGLVPDWAIRYGIRALHKKRLQEESVGTCEDWQSRMEDFVCEAQKSPIAIVPEKANSQHYEVPSSFFQKALGARLKYSSCYWSKGITTLDQAEIAALETTAKRAGIEDGMKILDLGCGWGSFSLWVAENYPNCQITAVSNSSVQKSYIEQITVEKGFNNLNVITADMNSFHPEGQFDRAVSIEMFEHMRNHKELLRRVSTWLKPAGKLFVHIFCHRQFVYPYETEGDYNWMGRHFFSGGIMPSDKLLLFYQNDLRLSHQWRWNGIHYEKTCNAWLKNIDRNKQLIMPSFEETYGSTQAEKWFVRWRLFFMACAELFAFNSGNEWWVSHYLFEKQV